MDTVWTTMDSILALPGDGGEATLLDRADAESSLDEMASSSNQPRETRTFTSLEPVGDWDSEEVLVERGLVVTRPTETAATTSATWGTEVVLVEPQLTLSGIPSTANSSALPAEEEEEDLFSQIN